MRNQRGPGRGSLNPNPQLQKKKRKKEGGREGDYYPWEDIFKGPLATIKKKNKQYMTGTGNEKKGGERGTMVQTTRLEGKKKSQWRPHELEKADG